MQKVVKITKPLSLLAKRDHFVLYDFFARWSRVMKHTKTTKFIEKQKFVKINHEGSFIFVHVKKRFPNPVSFVRRMAI